MTITEDLCTEQCLDYIFELIPKEDTEIDEENPMSNNEEPKRKLRLKPESIKIENFFVSDQPFTQLSDHYGISIELELCN